MKTRSKLLLPMVVLLVAVFVSGQAVFTEFDGTVPAGIIHTFGTILCPGGEQAGPFPPNPPCTPGSRVHVRGLVVEHDTTGLSDPRVAGTMIEVFNANTDGWTRYGPGSGPLWGTARLEVNEGGVWEGTWTGEREVTADGALSTLRFEMTGSGGRIEGLKSKWEIVAPHTGQSTVTGRILAPGRK